MLNLGSPQKHHKIGRVVEVLIIAAITLTIIFWVPMGLGCREFEPTRALGAVAESRPQQPGRVGEMPTTICPDGQYSDVAAMLLAPKEQAIKALFTRHFKDGANFEISGLVFAALITYVLTLLTFGSAMPAGLFIPNILFGACVGRVLGEEVSLMAPDIDVHPGVYALMGAAGMLAGFSRMTVSLVMIMLEITSNMRMLMPLMLTIMIAKVVGDRFTVSVYDIILELNPSIRMLESHLEEDRALVLEQLNVHDVCSVQVTALTADCSLSSIIQVLRVTQYAGYPVVDDERHVLGFVKRIQLTQILCEYNVEMDDDLALDGNPMIDVLQYADISPETIHWMASVSRGFTQFTATGIQHLCVVNEFNMLLGILTRTDFSSLTAHGAHGRKEVQRVINQRHAIAASGQSFSLIINGDQTMEDIREGSEPASRSASKAQSSRSASKAQASRSVSKTQASESVSKTQSSRSEEKDGDLDIESQTYISNDSDEENLIPGVVSSGTPSTSRSGSKTKIC